MQMFMSFLLISFYSQAIKAQEPDLIDVSEELQVHRKMIDVRVFDAKGNPMTGLTGSDFRLRVGRVEIPILYCEWVDSGVATHLGSEPDDLPVTKLSHKFESRQSGRRIVMFLQGDITGARQTGLMRGAQMATELLSQLNKEDLVSVFSFVSHLKMHSDWTRDKRQIEDAIWDALKHKDEFWPSDDPNVCIEDHFDSQTAKDIANPERALGYIGEALEATKGTKVLFFIGWGLGRFSSSGVSMTPQYDSAVQKLTQSRVTVYSLDISRADYHSLEVGMKSVSKQTGGFYQKTHQYSKRVFEKALRASRGYYLLTFEPPDSDPPHAFKINLVGRKGELLVKDPRFW